MRTKENTFLSTAIKGLVLALLVVAALAIGGMRTNAAETLPQVTNVKQVSASSSSVAISWDSLEGQTEDVRYMYVLKDANGKVLGDPKDAYTFYQNVYISGLNAGKVYKVSVYAYKKAYVSGNSVITATGTPSADIDVVTKLSGKITNLKQATTGNSTTQITMTWSGVSGASGYYVEYYKSTDSSSTAKKVVVTSNKAVLKGLSKNANYTIRVSAYKKSSKGFLAYDDYGCYATAYSIGVIPNKISGVALDTFYPSIRVADFSWNKAASATGYQYQIYSTNGKTKYVSKTTTSSSASLSKKLKMNNFYKLRVRGYRTISGSNKYGSWSDWKYISGGTSNINVKKATGKLSLSWNKVSGATNYTVYVSTKRPSGGNIHSMTKVKTTSKTSYTLKKLKSSKISKKKTYYVVVVANKKVGKTTYKSTPYHYYYK